MSFLSEFKEEGHWESHCLCWDYISQDQTCHFLHTFCHPFTLSRWSCLHLSCDNGDVMG